MKDEKKHIEFLHGHCPHVPRHHPRELFELRKTAYRMRYSCAVCSTAEIIFYICSCLYPCGEFFCAETLIYEHVFRLIGITPNDNYVR